MGIHDVQAQGIYHSDLHPGNFLVERIVDNKGQIEYRLIVSDFGLSEASTKPEDWVRKMQKQRRGASSNWRIWQNAELENSNMDQQRNGKSLKISEGFCRNFKDQKSQLKITIVEFLIKIVIFKFEKILIQQIV